MSPELEDLIARLDADSTAVYDDASKAAFSRWGLMQQAAAELREQADEIERLRNEGWGSDHCSGTSSDAPPSVRPDAGDA